MDVEYRHTVVKFRQLHIYLTVETSGTQQGLVKDVGAVGGGKDNHAAVGPETVHLGEQLVEGVFALIVGTHFGIFPTGTADSVNLIYENDTGGFFLGFLEKVSHAGSAHTHKHLHEIRA